MNLNVRKVMIVISALSAFFLTSLEATADETKSENDTAAIVNGTVITKKDLDIELEQTKQRYQSQGANISEAQIDSFRKAILDNLIAHELLYQESMKKNIHVDDEAIEKQLSTIKQRYPGDKEFKEALEKMNLTEKIIKSKITQTLTVNKFIEGEIASKIEVKDEESKKFYDEHPEYFKQPEKVKASHILVKLDPKADEEKTKEARKKIETIQAKIKDGGDFAELAKEHSEGPSNTRGGDLGFFARGQMVKPFEEAAFKTEPGNVTDVVKTSFGFHLIKVIEKNPETTVSYEESKDKISKHLVQNKTKEEVDQLIEKLKKESEIKIF